MTKDRNCTMKIIIAGLGYVGSATAVMFAGQNQVLAMDPNTEKLNAIQNGLSPLKDTTVEAIFRSRKISVQPLPHRESIPADADYVVVAVPTDWSPDQDSFDTHHIEDVVRLVEESHSQAALVIRSTVPVGFTRQLSERFPHRVFLFCPEFLREGSAMQDALYPQRIVIGRCGTQKEAIAKAEIYGNLMKEGIRQLRPKDYTEPPILFMETEEAEAVKLFSNTYLAARVAFFNELDAFAEQKGLDAARIIQGVCLDYRIGNIYNNPSFGYGGYCLPKDSRQLRHDAESPAGSLLHAVVKSNENRKSFVAQRLLETARAKAAPGERPVIGFYRLTAKTESEDIRSAAILDITRQLLEEDIFIVLYEPTLTDQSQAAQWFPPAASGRIRLEPDLAAFKEACPVIAANRWDEVLEDVREKVYTRDVFGMD